MENIQVSKMYVSIAKYEFLVINNEKLEFSALKRSPLLLTMRLPLIRGISIGETHLTWRETTIGIKRKPPCAVKAAHFSEKQRASGSRTH